MKLAPAQAECEVQSSRFNNVFTITACASNFVCLLFGYLMDQYGTWVSRTACCLMITCGATGKYDRSTHFDRAFWVSIFFSDGCDDGWNIRPDLHWDALARQWRDWAVSHQHPSRQFVPVRPWNGDYVSKRLVWLVVLRFSSLQILLRVWHINPDNLHCVFRIIIVLSGADLFPYAQTDVSLQCTARLPIWHLWIILE